MSRPLLTLTLVVALASPALADPCGMVPPIYTGDGPPIVRIGIQKTYVSFKAGIESFVIRPGYQGKVDEFGMLIPFPSPPAIRKVADDVFAHLTAAIDPPGVQLAQRRHLSFRSRGAASGGAPGRRLQESEIRVLSQEAVGMYEVAVLEAGSSAALNRWMDDHGFSYPDGMDATCEEYIQKRWCFVAVKTRVGKASGVKPKPGMRQADPSIPEGAGFDGHVQAMGFRFRTPELVVPMRLSAFNDGELRNVIYLLTDQGVRADRLPTSFVKRQVKGQELYRSVSEPLPVYVNYRGGTTTRGSRDHYAKQEVFGLRESWPGLAARRQQSGKNGYARDLFASDLWAIANGRLANPHEEKEKELLNLAERLGMRGDELDRLHREALAADHEQAAEQALSLLKGMVLTVIDGDFPRQVLAENDLTFTAWELEAEKNTRASYDCLLAQANPGFKKQLWFRGVEAPEPMQPLPAGWKIGEPGEQPPGSEDPQRQGFAPSLRDGGAVRWALLALLAGALAWRRRSD